MKNVIVALEASKHDKSILSYLKKIHEIYSFEKICFVHVVPEFLLSQIQTPEGVLVESSLQEVIREKIQEDIATHFSTDSSLIDEVAILFGAPYRKIAELVEKTEPDLLVVGKKKGGSGITPRRIAHNVKCNVLFVADIHPDSIETIVVPTDYSKHTVLALEEALYVREKLETTTVQSVHVIRMLPSDYYYGLDANHQYFNVLKDSAQKAYTTMLEEAEISESLLEAVYLDDRLGNVARSLHEYIEETSPDLVVLGAVGHSTVNNILFGSTAERLVSHCRSTCILLVR